VDASLKAWELAVRAAADFAQGALADITYFPPPMTAHVWPSTGLTGQQLKPTDSQVGVALQSWLDQAECVASSTVDDDLRTMLGLLNVCRDKVRSELSREEALVQPQKRDGLTEAQVVARVRHTSNQFGSEKSSLDSMLRVQPPTVGRQPNFLGGVRLPLCCTKCHLSSWAVNYKDSRVHHLLPHVMHAARYDPVRAFGLQYAVPQFSRSSINDPCSNCGGLESTQCSWYDASCVTDSAPPLLGLCWDVNVGQVATDQLLLDGCFCQLDESARDSAELQTSYGSVTYSLVTLILFDSVHFVTVGRTVGSELGRWVCWDGKKNKGVGHYLRLPPTGSGILEAEYGASWSGYQAVVAFYCRRH
jgi:hypothetical protein